MIPKEKTHTIVKLLKEKGADRPCSRCDNRSFTLVEEYFDHMVGEPIKKKSLTTYESIPYIATVCTHCGFINQHVLRILEYEEV